MDDLVACSSADRRSPSAAAFPPAPPADPGATPPRESRSGRPGDEPVEEILEGSGRHLVRRATLAPPSAAEWSTGLVERRWRLPDGGVRRLGGPGSEGPRLDGVGVANAEVEIARYGSRLRVRTPDGCAWPFDVDGVTMFSIECASPVVIGLGAARLSWDGHDGLELLDDKPPAAGGAVDATPGSSAGPGAPGADALWQGWAQGKQLGFWVSQLTSSAGDGSPDLRGLTFVAPPGLTVLCGPSGLGKTTLLRALCGERELGEASRLTLRGAEFDPQAAFAGGQAVFMPQEFSLIGNLTAFEAVDFSHRLRVSPARRASRRARVAQLLAELDLADARDVPVRALSGGQRKRLSLAAELVVDPALLLLDEPNSGLDPQADRELMGLLRNIGRIVRGQNPAVIVVSHLLAHCEPTDWFVALGRDAGTLDRGPGEHAPAGPCVVYCGPFAAMPEHVTGDGTASHADVMARLRTGSAPHAMDGSIRRGKGRPGHRGGGPGRYRRAARRFEVLCAREMRRQANDWLGGRRARSRPRRLPVSLRWALSQVSSPVLIGVVVALMAEAVCPEPMGVEHQGHSLAAILTLVILVCFVSISYTAPTVMGDWDVLKREKRWGVAVGGQVLARLVSNMLRSCIVAVVASVVFVAVTPDPADPVADRLLVFCAVLSVLALISLGFGLLLGALVSGLKQVMVVMFIVMAALVVLSGCAFALDGLGVGVKWGVSLLLPSRWAVAALAGEFGLSWDQPDRLWGHSPVWLVRDLGALAALCPVYLALANWRIKRNLRRL